MSALQSHRDSLSPDSAAEEATGGGSKLRNRDAPRRDSRPHLSPDGDSCGLLTLGPDGSPRGGRLRRQSTTTEDIFK